MEQMKKGVGYILMTIGALSVLAFLAVIIMVQFFPQAPLSLRVVDAIENKDGGEENALSLNIYEAFRTTLQSEVRGALGQPIEGYEPSMFLQVFPGLSETDFEGVEASIGHYTVEKGRLVHQMDDSRLVHSAAGAITDRGMDTLLNNVSARLKVDLHGDGTLTKIMNALVYEEGVSPAPAPYEPIACTMDAKICPDGSAVGREGPQCEFAPCPGM